MNETDPDELATMIEDCEKRSEKLTEWELKFIDSVSSQERPLSPKQIGILNRIWERVT